RMSQSHLCRFLRAGTHLALTAVFVFVISVSSARSQDLDNVTISGKVTDQNGAVIPNASVTSRLIKTGVERTVVADNDGRYKIIQLEPGVYAVKASFANFATEEQTDLTTIAGQNVQLDFTLKPAGVTASAVVVSASETPQVDTTRSVVGLAARSDIHSGRRHGRTTLYAGPG
ncbi:MAG: hypothetical protein DMF71_07820, partial [Acidobacteria bacterium]